MTDPEVVQVGRYLAYDEGCYECYEPGQASGVIGFYGTRDEAEAAARAAEQRHQAAWTGEHFMGVIDLAEPKMSEYGDAR